MEEYSYQNTKLSDDTIRNNVLSEIHHNIKLFAKDKELELNKNLHNIVEPIKYYQHNYGIVRFYPENYHIKYYVLPNDFGTILVRLYKNEKIYYDDSLEFSINQNKFVSKNELLQLLDKLDYEILRKNKPKPSVSIIDPNEKQKIRIPNGKQEIGSTFNYVPNYYQRWLEQNYQNNSKIDATKYIYQNRSQESNKKPWWSLSSYIA